MSSVTVMPRLDASMTPKDKQEYLNQIKLATELQHLCNDLELAVEKRAAMARVLARPEVKQMLEDEALAAIKEGFVQSHAEAARAFTMTDCERKDREQATREKTLANDHKTTAYTGTAEVTYAPPERLSDPSGSVSSTDHLRAELERIAASVGIPLDPVEEVTRFGSGPMKRNP